MTQGLWGRTNLMRRLNHSNFNSDTSLFQLRSLSFWTTATDEEISENSAGAAESLPHGTAFWKWKEFVSTLSTADWQNGTCVQIWSVAFLTASPTGCSSDMRCEIKRSHSVSQSWCLILCSRYFENVSHQVCDTVWGQQNHGRHCFRGGKLKHSEAKM